MKKFEDNKGYAMVIVIIIITILLTLTTVLVNIAIGEYRQAERNKNDVKSYFLARSGAELTASYIINNGQDSIDELRNPYNEDPNFEGYNLNNDSDSNFISSINIFSKGNNLYEIVSTAEIEGVLKTVKVNIKKNNLFDTAIFAKNNLDFSKMEYLDLDGEDINVETNGDTINDPDDFIPDDQEITNSDKSFESIDWETNEIIAPLVSAGKVSIDADTIGESAYYEDVKYNNGTLNIDFTENDTINIAVDNFEFKAAMDFKTTDGDLSNKHLNLFVKDSITFQTPNVEIPNLNIFLMKDSEITLIANSDLPDDDGIFVYGPEATMIMQSNKTHFAGSIIVDSFEGQGNLAMGSYTYQSFSKEDKDYIEGIIENNYFISSWSR